VKCGKGEGYDTTQSTKKENKMQKIGLTMLLIGILCISSAYAQNMDNVKAAIQKHESKEPSQEALERKKQSQERLKKENVPYIESLPVIEDSKEVKIKTVDEIANRTIALFICSAKGVSLDNNQVNELIKKFQIKSSFSPDELKFIKSKRPSKKDKVIFSWRWEACWVLLWSLGYIDSLSRPDTECDVDKAVKIFDGLSTKEFINNAKLRPVNEILDQADLIYRYHWATVDARIKGKQSPAGLNEEIIVEWHHALNWLIGYMGQEWDDVSTDT
jgi:hypothetical protein